MAQTGKFQKEQKSANVPLWREAYSGLDWLALKYSPVYYGLGVPRGDGSAVLVVPGFMASDVSLLELNFWLRRMGYKAYNSNIGRNSDCFDHKGNLLGETVEKAYRETGRKVHLIGHSLGGMLARSVAGQKSEMVASVITMGSPFKGIKSHPIVLEAGEAVRRKIQTEGKRPANCFTGYCNCKGFRSLEQGLNDFNILQTAIYSKRDGVVDWRNCINDDVSTNFEVYSTHVGMAFNPFVYRLIGNRLDEARRQQTRPQTEKQAA